MWRDPSPEPAQCWRQQNPRSPRVVPATPPALPRVPSGVTAVPRWRDPSLLEGAGKGLSSPGAETGLNKSSPPPSRPSAAAAVNPGKILNLSWTFWSR